MGLWQWATVYKRSTRDPEPVRVPLKMDNSSIFLRQPTTQNGEARLINQNSKHCGEFLCNYCFDNNLRVVFASKMELGSHEKLRHPREYAERCTLKLRERRAVRWHSEDLEVMVCYEVEGWIRERELVEHFNLSDWARYLAKKLLTRTVGAIKARRRSGQYQREVARQLSLHNLAPSSPDQPVQTSNRVNPEPNNVCSLEEALKAAVEEGLASCSKLVFAGKSVLLRAASKALQLGNPEDEHMVWFNKSVVGGRVGGKTSDNGSLSTSCPSSFWRKNKETKCDKGATEFSKIQKLFEEDPSLAAEYILEGKCSKVKEEFKDLNPRIVVNKWAENFSQVIPVETATLASFPCDPCPSKDEEIMIAINCDDIRRTELGVKTTPGPDNVTTKQWRAVPIAVRALFYNLLLVKGEINKSLITSRTSLIPKVSKPTEAKHFRPISVTSVVLRQFHKILVSRMSKTWPHDDFQRGFIHSDGVIQNVAMTQALIHEAKTGGKDLHIASVDLTNAFGSVSHKAVFRALEVKGFSAKFAAYVKDAYGKASTEINFCGISKGAPVNCGILQGDPLSPCMFNHVIDLALREIDNSLGFSIGGQRVSKIAFADDIELVASTTEGLRLNLLILVRALQNFGLKVNLDKTAVLSIVHDRKEKKAVIWTEAQFKVQDSFIKQIGPTDEWKYLGIKFVGEEISKNLGGAVLTDVSRVSSSSTTPQQKMMLLREHVVARHIHSLVLGNASATSLSVLDGSIRRVVREWLSLPHDCPSAYLNAPVKVGGLGIPSLALMVPRIRAFRLINSSHSNTESINRVLRESEWVRNLIVKSERELDCIGGSNKLAETAFWQRKLGESYDTKDLMGSNASSASTWWACREALNLSARDYVIYNKVRSGCLPTASRLKRGRESASAGLCRYACGVSETNYHVVQDCRRVRGGVILRHNRVVKLLCEAFSSGLGRVYEEPHLETICGKAKPDILIIGEEVAMVIDVQIVRGDNMTRDSKVKRAKYRDWPGLDSAIIRKYYVNKVVYEAVTISYKGVWESETVELMSRLGVQPSTIHVVTTSILRGSYLNYHTFMRNPAGEEYKAVVAEYPRGFERAVTDNLQPYMV